MLLKRIRVNIVIEKLFIDYNRLELIIFFKEEDE